ncbi:unnamed protein product, partial [Heterosigma akashiwo]
MGCGASTDNKNPGLAPVDSNAVLPFDNNGESKEELRKPEITPAAVAGKKVDEVMDAPVEGGGGGSGGGRGSDTGAAQEDCPPGEKTEPPMAGLTQAPAPRLEDDVQMEEV